MGIGGMVDGYPCSVCKAIGGMTIYHVPADTALCCGRCDKDLIPDDFEYCWYCAGYLCMECWNKYGHCGHREADEANAQAAARAGKGGNEDVVS